MSLSICVVPVFLEFVWNLPRDRHSCHTVCDATCRYWLNEWLLVSFPRTPISFSLVQSKNRHRYWMLTGHMPNMFYSNDAVQPQWSSDSFWRPTAEWVPVRSTPLPLGLQRLLRQRRFDQQPQVDPNIPTISPISFTVEPSEFRVIQSGQISTRCKSTTLGSWELWTELNTPLNIFQNYGI